MTQAINQLHHHVKDYNSLLSTHISLVHKQSSNPNFEEHMAMFHQQLPTENNRVDCDNLMATLLFQRLRHSFEQLKSVNTNTVKANQSSS